MSAVDAVAATVAPVLDAEAVRNFRTHGFLVVPGLLSGAPVAAVNANLTRLVREADADGRHPAGLGIQFEPGAAAAGTDPALRELLVRKFHDFGQADAFFWDHLRQPRIIALLDALLGPGALLLQSMALVKPPEIGSPKHWHQDLPYFSLAPAAALGLWIAGDDTDLGNGCMQVVPGSQRGGAVPHVQGPSGWMLPPEAAAQAARAAIALPMPAGSALVFDAALWHFTGDNRSPKRRRALQYHYVAAGTRRLDGELWPLDLSRPPRAGAPPQVAAVP